MPINTRERERNFSVGSARSSARSARSNSIIGTQSVVGTSTDERWNLTPNSESSSQALLENATAIGSAIKTRLKQVRSTVTGGSSCAVFNNSGGGSVNVSSSTCLSLLEAEFKVLFLKFYFFLQTNCYVC